jgi:LysM repeat protein
MVKKRVLMILLVFILGFSAAACTRSLRKPVQQEVPASQMTETIPEGEADVMEQIYLFATQTAMVEQGVTLADDAGSEIPAGTPAPESTDLVEDQEPDIESPQEPEQTIRDVPTATPGKPDSYTLQKGEFPYCIARRFNVNPNELLRANNLTKDVTIQPGTTLKLPKSDRNYPGSRKLRDHPTTYTVKSGDTVFSIACIFGDADPNAIAYANNLVEPYELSVGQELYIP